MKKKPKRKTPSRKKPPSGGPPVLSAEFISLDQLYHAYRKAKIDVFYERSQPMTLAFCEYERDLHANLVALQKKLTTPRPNWFRKIDFIGEYGFIPKGLQVPPRAGDEGDVTHFSVSSPDDAWELLVEQLEQGSLAAEFRPVAVFTVDMYVVCALWVNLVGHMFDACLDQSARGSRLRRLRKDSDRPGSVGRYHLSAPGSFQPYFHCYQQWRAKGLRAIRHELSEKRKVVAITMDLKAFYHNVDPRFILEPEFFKKIRFRRVNERNLSAEEKTFTNQVAEAFVTWSGSLPHLGKDGPPGIPVGPSAPRIIANVLLAEFDRLAQRHLDPIYYSRYVDDIFLVLRDNGRLRSSTQVLKHLCRRIPPLKVNKDASELTLDLPYAKGCKLLFQAKKQRIFLLSGEVGADLLDTIESKIDEVSSEWRLLPDLDALERSPAAKVLTANRHASEDADTLRKADQLSLKRLSLSIMLGHHDTLAHDLPPGEWKLERHRFYRFAERHVLTPLRFLDLNDYLPRLIALAVTCRDWKVARRLLNRIQRAIRQLKDNISIELEEGAEEQWNGYVRHLQLALREAVVRAYPLDSGASTTASAVHSLQEKIDALNGSLPNAPEDTATVAGELFWMDLGRTPFRHSMLGYSPVPHCPLPPWSGILPESQMERFSVIREFIHDSEHAGIKLRPLLFPTRPFSAREVTEFDRSSATDLDRLRKFVVALRGTWVKAVDEDRDGNGDPGASGEDGTGTSDVVVIGDRHWRRPPRIAVTSFLVDEISWAKAAEGNPDLSASRYRRLVTMANAIVMSPHRPDYVVFPELSIPRKWLPGLVGLFMKAGMSLITGVEYRRVPPEPATHVVNEAYLFLADDRLGYRTWCAVRQRKGAPAHHERDQLRGRFGLTLDPPSTSDRDKRVYRHFGHDFGVLICSELTNIRFRQGMRGNVDTLFVLSWNQDLESFGALVEAAALDVHCYMALINNRKYGDSRVRAPLKKHWKRDLVRVKGGLDDYFVVTELDIVSLRDFQSYHEPPLDENAEFKPTPEGFRIADRRRRTPG